MKKTILIQGAMKEEIKHLLRRFKAHKQVFDNYNFYLANYHGHKIVISLTNQGTINATTATKIAIKYFHPNYVINTGLCGSHLKTLHVHNIIVGDVVTYLKKSGKCLTLKGSKKMSRLVDTIPTKLNIFHGIMGSANIFTKKEKEINAYRKNCHHMTEDMESIAVYYECEETDAECIAIRIVSNNEILKETYEDNHLKADHLLQDFICRFINALIKD